MVDQPGTPGSSAIRDVSNPSGPVAAGTPAGKPQTAFDRQWTPAAGPDGGITLQLNNVPRDEAALLRNELRRNGITVNGADQPDGNNTLTISNSQSLERFDTVRRARASVDYGVVIQGMSARDSIWEKDDKEFKLEVGPETYNLTRGELDRAGIATSPTINWSKRNPGNMVIP